MTEAADAILIVVEVLLGASLLTTLFHLLRVRTLIGRIVALEVIAAITVGGAALITMVNAETAAIDVALAVGLVSFTGTVAFAAFFEDGTSMIELIASLVALAGAIFLGLAAMALTRMPDVYGRLSATSKAVTLGATLLLAAAAIYARDPGVTARAIAGMAFLLLTSPIAGHVLGRAAWRAGEEPTVVHREAFPTGPDSDEDVPAPPPQPDHPGNREF